jgi:hypothetical protein
VLLVAGLSAAAVLGAPTLSLVPFSYGVFGLMWFATAFLKTPLTAYYSQNNYGGGTALKNPLFMRTNRILTVCWGVLYLITPLWTYWLMTTAVAPFVGLINSAAPALMGAFTAWFQRWYPARWARK